MAHIASEQLRADGARAGLAEDRSLFNMAPRLAAALGLLALLLAGAAAQRNPDWTWRQGRVSARACAGGCCLLAA